MDIAAARERTEEFLTVQMLHALESVDYALPRFDTEPVKTTLEDAARARVEYRHVRGASDCIYLIEAFGDALLMQLQLNVWRLVVVYRVPATSMLDAASLEARLERWRKGAEHAGWTFGWRDALDPSEAGQRFVEVYCYSMTDRDFLDNPLQQLYWRTDIVQMTRYFMLETRRSGITLSPRGAGYAL